MALLEVQDLQVRIYTRRGTIMAVNGVTFHVDQGEVLGLVGESGCGKSMTCRAILRLLPKPGGRIEGGQVLWDGQDLLQLSENEMRQIRGRHIALIPQEPVTSLNPVLTVGDQLMESIRLHLGLRGLPKRQLAREMLRLVQIPAAEERLGSYPHEMSGGMRQRVVGAIALSCQPRLVLADEPTSSLDPTIQSQYLKLLRDIQRQTSLSTIFVTHDFGILTGMCDRVAVMYAGKIVETAPVRRLFEQHRHPYTRALLASVPPVDRSVKRLYAIDGEPPLLQDLPPGCAFAPRCDHTEERCHIEFPPCCEVVAGHQVHCWGLL